MMREMKEELSPWVGCDEMCLERVEAERDEEGEERMALTSTFIFFLSCVLRLESRER